MGWSDDHFPRREFDGRFAGPCHGDCEFDIDDHEDAIVGRSGRGLLRQRKSARYIRDPSGGITSFRRSGL